MSNLHNQEQLENIHNQIIEWDRKNQLDTEINHIAINYSLDADDDRDEILQFIAELIFYDNYEVLLT
jgi:hypothetical protein